MRMDHFAWRTHTSAVYVAVLAVLPVLPVLTVLSVASVASLPHSSMPFSMPLLGLLTITSTHMFHC